MAGAQDVAPPIDKPKPKYRRFRKYVIESRQEINPCLKYILFLVNFLFWICGIACAILGIYLYAKDYRAVFEAMDFFLNPSILLIISGLLIFVIAFLGCTGALRENVFMLKLFSLFLFFAYICLVILAFVVFMLFYSDSRTGLSMNSLLQSGVRKYHENDNMRELMDYLQTTLGCCGASSQGYKDWNMNGLYNCSTANTNPEQCGVPSSCCKSSATISVTANPQINSVSSLSGSPAANLILEKPETELPSISTVQNTMRNPRCGFHAQEKSITDLQNVLYTDGCLSPLQRVFEANAVVIGAIIGAIIIPVCLSVTFSNVLAKQIERQRYLLEKEARKEERRRRRNRSKFRDPFETRTSAPNVGRGQKRTSHPEVITELKSIPQKDSNIKLIIEDDQNRAGPSDVKKSEKKIATEENPRVHQIRKRCGNADLPPIPPDLQNQPDKKKRKDSHDQPQGKMNLKFSAQNNFDDQKRQNHKSRRSKSRDPNPTPYNGPIIVEIASIPNEAPPATDPENIVILDESVSDKVDEERKDSAKNENDYCVVDESKTPLEQLSCENSKSK